MILSAYIDYDKAVEELLKDRENKMETLENLLYRLEEAKEIQISVSAVDTSRIRVIGGIKPDRNEDIMLEIQELKSCIALIQKEETMFQEVWNRLSEEEKLVLDCFYIHSKKERQEMLDEVCEKLHCERAEAYKKKTRAIKRFKQLLAG